MAREKTAFPHFIRNKSILFFGINVSRTQTQRHTKPNGTDDSKGDNLLLFISKWTQQLILFRRNHNFVCVVCVHKYVCVSKNTTETKIQAENFELYN